MQLLRLRDVPTGPNDRVFRHPRMRALIIWLAAFAGVVAIFFYAFTGKWKLGYVFGAFALLFLLFFLRLVTARFHPSNWLVRMNETGIYVQYRSYLNYNLPPDDPSVLFLSFGEIASARRVKERLQTPDPMRPNTTQTQFLHHVELELPGDIASVANALNSERGENAPMQKRWYGGSSATVYRDYPVTMNAPPFLRIHWNVVPRTKKFLNLLRPYTPILETVSVHEDFSNLKYLPPEKQKERLRELAERGDVIAATYAAQQIHGCGLSEAKRIIDGLLAEKSSAGV